MYFSKIVTFKAPQLDGGGGGADIKGNGPLCDRKVRTITLLFILDRCVP